MQLNPTQIASRLYVQSLVKSQQLQRFPPYRQYFSAINSTFRNKNCHILATLHKYNSMHFAQRIMSRTEAVGLRCTTTNYHRAETRALTCVYINT